MVVQASNRSGKMHLTVHIGELCLGSESKPLDILAVVRDRPYLAIYPADMRSASVWPVSRPRSELEVTSRFLPPLCGRGEYRHPTAKK